jgi:hypothetical protein
MWCLRQRLKYILTKRRRQLCRYKHIT